MNKQRRPVLAALACMGLLLGACGDNRTDSERVAAAYESIEKTRYREAVIDLRNLLRANSDNAEARLALGVALLELGDAAAAEKELLRARDLGAAANDYMEYWARALQRRQAHVEVVAEIDPSQVDDPVKASTLRALVGRSKLAMNDKVTAAQVFDAELAAGQSVEAQRIALVGKAAIANEKGDFAGAEALAKRSLDLAPDSAESLLVLAQILIVEKKFKEALDLVGGSSAQAVRANPMDRFMIAVQRTEAFIGSGDLEAARTSGEELSALSKDHPLAGYLRGRVEFESGDLDKAVEYFQDVLATYPTFVPAQTLMGAAMMQREEYEQAEMFLSNAVAGEPRNAGARQLLAETRLRMRRPDAAMETAADGLRNNADNPELLAMLGRATVQLGDHEAGIEILRQAVAAEPDSVQAKLALASAFVAQGNGEEAVALLESLPEGSMDEQRRKVLIVIAQINREDEADVRAKITALAEDSPDDAFVLALAGSYYALSGDIAAARGSYEHILELEPDNQSAMLNLLRLDELSGDFARSQALFEAAYAKDEQDPVVVIALARIYQAQGDDERAMALVVEANQRDPAALMPNIMLAGRALRNADLATAEQYATAAVTNHSNSAHAHAVLGLVNMRQFAFEAALAGFTRAVEIAPDMYHYHFYRGHAQWASKGLAQARKSFIKVLELHPTHLLSIRALAILELRAKNVEAAAELVGRLEETMGDDPAALEIVGDIRAVQGQSIAAIESYKRAAQLQPSRDLATKLYKLRQHEGMTDPARPLRQWIEQTPDDVQARLMLAQDYQRASRQDAAIEQYEAIVTLQPDNPLALNNLAWLYYEKSGAESIARSLELAARAHQLAPANADIADTYGWILFQTNSVDEGVSMLRKAIAASSAEASPDIAFHLAAALSEKGDGSEAKAILASALTSKATFVSRDDAQRLHDSL